MALWLCLGCTTKYAVGLFRCPRCHGTEFVEDGQPMPKITNAGGASNASDQTVEGVESSPGNSSSASTPKPETSSEPSAPKTRRRAQTTASPSSEDPTASSTAPTTVGAPTEPTSEIASDAGE